MAKAGCVETNVTLKAAPVMDVCPESALPAVRAMLAELAKMGIGSPQLNPALLAAREVIAREQNGVKCCEDQQAVDVGRAMARAFLAVMVEQGIDEAAWIGLYPRDLRGQITIMPAGSSTAAPGGRLNLAELLAGQPGAGTSDATAGLMQRLGGGLVGAAAAPGGVRGRIAGAAVGALSPEISEFIADATGTDANTVQNTLGAAATGAAAGSMLGPVGAAVGGLLGGGGQLLFNYFNGGSAAGAAPLVTDAYPQSVP